MIVAKNKKAYFDYEILKEYEAGLVLKGWEVKSIKSGGVSLKESHVAEYKGGLWVYGMHVNFWKFTNTSSENSETQPRKLLMHSQEISNLIGKIKEKGLSMVPIDIHLSRGRIKMQVALVRGKKLFDKREQVKKRELDRDLKQEFKRG